MRRTTGKLAYNKTVARVRGHYQAFETWEEARDWTDKWLRMHQGIDARFQIGKSTEITVFPWLVWRVLP